MKQAAKLNSPDTSTLLELVQELRCSVEVKDHEITLLKEKISYLIKKRFGAKSEQYDPRQGLLFGEDEVAAVVEEVELEDKPVVPAKKKKGGRRIPPKTLPHVRVEHDLSEADKVCSCQQKMDKIGEETSYQYDVIPTKFQVLENVRIKYACTNPDCNCSIKLAKLDPPAPLPGSQASAGLLAWLGTSKFSDGMPTHRIAKMAEKRFGVPFNSTTLSEWQIKAANRILQPIASAIEKQVANCSYIHADETTYQVLNEPDRLAKQKSYIWLLVSGQEEKPFVFMQYSPSRAAYVANELLKDFKGYLHTDGYPGYNHTASRDDVIQLGCWAHVRRKFVDVNKSSPEGALNVAKQATKLIAQLYRLDHQGKDMPSEQRNIQRKDIVKPHLDTIQAWIEANKKLAADYGGKLSIAFTYIQNQWRKLVEFINDHRLNLDNNRAERHIRPIALGRKVWLFSNSQAGAKANAIWYSVIETAKANGLEPYWYLKKIFAEIPARLRDESSIDDLLPWNLKSPE
ncbi:MAG: IS66 family transposase [Ghiorsea sp.]